MSANPGFISRIAALWKRGWHEIPEVMASSVLAAALLPVGAYSVYLYDKKHYYKEFRTKYTIYRSDDPRLQEIPHNK
ncbi:uncharacterized protein NdufA3 [Centruroides vittatus]|uniref:uncharacterized protein NdufA3 n=1 Tax=Centruroides vittatus TaxID=120091 RepID=UPI00350F399D